MFLTFRKVISSLNFRNFAIKPGYCPVCGRTMFVKLDDHWSGIRCIRCRGSNAALGLIEVLLRNKSNLNKCSAYEMSSRGAIFNFIKSQTKDFEFSEYYDGIAPGALYKGVRCQDVQKLTYPNEKFDIVTSTEVFEHVPDDCKGFSEIYRVLRSGGKFVFTVPIEKSELTIERAIIDQDGRIKHILTPEYHDDRIRGKEKVLCFRNYGRDILSKLRFAGFSSCKIDTPKDFTGWGFTREVICACK